MTDKTQNPELDGLDETAGHGAPPLADTDRMRGLAESVVQSELGGPALTLALIAALTAEREAHAGDEALRRKQVVGLQDQLAIERDRAEQAERQVRAGLALADEWRYKGEFGWGAWQEGEGPDLECTVLDECASKLRAALSGVPGPSEQEER